MRSANADAFLIIHVERPDAFMQLTGDAAGVQLDFPLITPRQRGREGTVREVAAREGLEVFEVAGSDGARFLDVEVNGGPAGVAAVCSKVLRGVFDVSGEAELVFEHVGLAPADGA